jgi:sugar lactone lactonase YvrE
MGVSRKRAAVALGLAVSLGAPATRADKIYWTELTGHQVVRADLNGENSEVLVTPAGERPMAIALAPSAGQMYWTFTGEIRRANLDGTGVESVMIGSSTAKGLVLDEAAGKIYWTGAEPSGCIYRANLDGSEVEVVLEQDALWLALDTAGDTIYWTSAGGVHRASLSARSAEVLIETTSGMAFEAIALDLEHGTMYWVESAGQRIRRANLDGTDVIDCLTGLSAPVGLAIDAYHGKIYWTDMGAIHRADLDCTGVEFDVIAGTDWPAGIALQIDCDNGVVDTGETCDVAISQGSPGACPLACDDGEPCTSDTLQDPGTCQARCLFTSIDARIDGDGCCPAGANANEDSDCDPVCGNAVCEIGEPETCTPDCRRGVPALSHWGLLSLALCLLAGARMGFRRRHARA